MSGCNTGSQFEFLVGSAGVIPISVRDVNGQPVDADATPTVSFLTLNGTGVDETNAAYNVAITQVQDDTPAAVTGEYQLTFDPSAFANGDVLEFGVSAAVNSVSLTTTKSAIVRDVPDQRPTLC